MINRHKHLFQKVGIDKAIGYTILSRVLQAGGGVIAILFISKYLNDTEQGYYYTFGSLIAIQLFFELGFTQVITQFVAHEAARLDWKNDQFSQSDIASSRLSSLLHFAIKWFVIMSVLLAVVLMLTGYFFFSKFHSESLNINWWYPFVILSIATGGTLLSTPLLAFLEGLGKVKEVAIIRFYQQAGYLLLLFTFFVSGFKLYSAPIAQLINFILPLFFILFSNNFNLLQNIFKQKGKYKVDYLKEIFPFQWRIAISWMSGFFIFQLFNPVLFANDGPVVAGQMGMTLSVLNGVMALSYTWFNTKSPAFSTLIAREQYVELDIIFKRTMKQAVLVCFLCLLFFILSIAFLQFFSFKLGTRFLTLPALVLVCIATLGNQISYGMATYLRCHKREPLMLQTVTMAGLMVLFLLILGRLYGVIGIAGSYCFLTTIIGVFWTYYTFQAKRVQWHFIKN